MTSLPQPMTAATPAAGFAEETTWRLQVRASLALTYLVRTLRTTFATDARLDLPHFARVLLVCALSQFEPGTTVEDVVTVLTEVRR